MTEDEKFMKAALAQAKKAAAIDEVPIGCVIVYEGKIIARGYNKRNKEKNTLSHAEMNAIRKASKYLGDWMCSMMSVHPCSADFSVNCGREERRKKRNVFSRLSYAFEVFF